MPRGNVSIGRGIQDASKENVVALQGRPEEEQTPHRLLQCGGHVAPPL